MLDRWKKDHEIKILDYTYTSQPSINTAVPLMFNKLKTSIYILSCIATLGFLWLLAKWSATRKAWLMYSTCQPQEATHFLITQQDIIGGSTIIQRQDRIDFKRRCKSVSFCYHDRNYLYHEQKQVFLPIRYEQLGLQLDRLQKGKFQPYSSRSRKKLLQYYGLNQIQLSIQSYIQVFIQQMLTPYEVFQLYAIILWIYEEYYIFAFMLLAYSLYTYWDNSREIVRNQQKLAENSYFLIKCKLVTRGKYQSPNEAQHGYDSEDYTILDERGDQGDVGFNLSQEVPRSPKPPSSDHLREERGDKGMYQVQEIQSNCILPGDIFILKQGDTVPCDCIIVQGQALVDESYISGENLIYRKKKLQNYQYQKQKQQSFLLYLGTKLLQVRPQKPPSCFLSQLLQPSQIACLATQTNYNTQRGKYLRAVRYQKKPTDNFTKQTIYFIYIILAITIVLFGALLPITAQGQEQWDVLILFLDLLATSIPITLPTALSVGINFAQLGLKKQGIHSVMPSNILGGGRASTLVIDCSRVLAKDYRVESIVVGVKASGHIGNTYATVEDMLDIAVDKESQSYVLDPTQKIQEINKMEKLGRIMLIGFTGCHNMEMYNSRIYGTSQEKSLFQFAQGKFLKEDTYKSFDKLIKIKQRIMFHPKQKKMAVICQVKSEAPEKTIQQIEQDAFQTDVVSETKAETFIIIKGSAENIISLCEDGTYPTNYNEYVVDIAEKGFKTVCYAYKIVEQEQEVLSLNNKNQIFKSGFIFCGFALLQIEATPENVETINELRQAKMQMILISDENELQTSSIAITNKMYNKNQLLLCSLKNEKIKCSGHLQWQSNSPENAQNRYNFNETVSDFIMQCDTFTRNCYLSLNSKLYEQLFMKREDQNCQKIFNNTMIYNEMDNRHSRNVYFQLQKRGKVTFAVGSGGSVSECAHLSMELERGQCSMLSSFHTSHKNIKCVTKCLIICRAALATNFHCFSMMVLFSLIQFTTVVNLYFRYQNLSDSQYLYEDLFVTFPIFITINMTAPVSRLGSQLPPTSFFSIRAISSMLGQFLLQLIVQIIFITYLFNLQLFQQTYQQAYALYVENGEFVDTNVTLITFVLTNYLYLGIVLSSSVSRDFRKPFYTNPYYTGTLILLWFYNTAIVFLPEIVPDSIRKQDLSQQVQGFLVMAFLIGNLVMVVMYLYENMLEWLLKYLNRLRNNRISYGFGN